MENETSRIEKIKNIFKEMEGLLSKDGSESHVNISKIADKSREIIEEVEKKASNLVDQAEDAANNVVDKIEDAKNVTADFDKDKEKMWRGIGTFLAIVISIITLKKIKHCIKEKKNKLKNKTAI